MQRCQKAVHLRTGDRETDGAVSMWLERHEVDVFDFADPFEACTFALTRPETTPDVAFIGADWLAPDELRIIDYLRETWPGLGMVIYGSTPATAGLHAGPQTLVLHPLSAVRRILVDSPAALLSRFPETSRTSAPPDDDWRPGLQTPPRDAQPPPKVRKRPFAPDAAVEQAKPAWAVPAPRVTPRDPEQQAGPSAPSTQTILTREELAALLEDDER